MPSPIEGVHVMDRVIAVLVAGLGTGQAWAQAPTPPLPAPPSTTAPAVSSSSGGYVAVTLVILALLVVIGIVVKLFDLKRKRSAEAVHLQAQISDALLREQNVFRLPVTPTAHIPFLKGTPAVVEISGEVPSSELKDTVLRLVKSEASRIRDDVRVEDRLAVRAA
jgi:hypothetical protein